MELDFEKALTYIAKDPQWVNKFLAGSGIILAALGVMIFPFASLLTGSSKSFCALMIMSCAVSVVLWLAVSGYVCETAHRRIKNTEDYTLPDWTDFGGLIALGFKYSIGYFLYFIPVLVVGLIFAGLCFFIGNPFAGFHHHMSGFSFGILVFAGAFLLFLYLLAVIFLPLVMSAFFEDKKVLSFVSFDKAAKLIKGNVSNYVMLIILFIAMSILVSIITSILCVTVVGYIFFPLVYMYAYLVISELCAQFVVSSKAEKTADTPSC